MGSLVDNATSISQKPYNVHIFPTLLQIRVCGLIHGSKANTISQCHALIIALYLQQSHNVCIIIMTFVIVGQP